GATVITNLFSAIPIVGKGIVEWLWGGFAVGNPTLNRFFSLHYLLPFAIFGVVAIHIWAFHTSGNNNPTGVEVKDVKKDTVPFHPYYTVKDGFAIAVFLLLFAAFVFFNPNGLGHPDNFKPADPLVTPPHIVPEWYFLPFYAILRAITFNIGPITSKLGGVIAMFASIIVLFVLPWLDTSKVRSMRYRPVAKLWFVLFVIACVWLGYLGGQPAEGVFVIQAQIATAYYFAFFLIILPLLGVFEKADPLPKSIADSVLSTEKPASMPIAQAAE
ncbi:MAG: cytochrome b N-terminal domain-containing protein, partial [Parvularculaceae bacterium]|nr:cytochrome b N-terminal domain-containing protein [Parvularculaceae bacterium]